MALAYLAASCIAALAAALIVSVNTGSIWLGIVTYSAAGTLLMCLVLVSALLRKGETDEADQAAAIPAE